MLWWDKNTQIKLPMSRRKTDKAVMQSVANRLSLLLARHNMTNADLSRALESRLNFVITAETVRSYRGGESLPASDALYAISVFFQKPMEWFFAGTPEREPTPQTVHLLTAAREVLESDNSILADALAKNIVSFVHSLHKECKLDEALNLIQSMQQENREMRERMTILEDQLRTRDSVSLEPPEDESSNAKAV